MHALAETQNEKDIDYKNTSSAALITGAVMMALSIFYILLIGSCSEQSSVTLQEKETIGMVIQP